MMGHLTGVSHPLYYRRPARAEGRVETANDGDSDENYDD
jgi:hypothetical protein